MENLAAWAQSAVCPIFLHVNIGGFQKTIVLLNLINFNTSKIQKLLIILVPSKKGNKKRTLSKRQLLNICSTLAPKEISTHNKMKKTMKLSKRPLHLLVVFGLMGILTGVAQAKTESINVEPGKELTRTIDLAAGDLISITFTVLGPDPSALHFFMVLPNGTTSDYGEISRYSIDFFTDTKGVCQLHFDNSNSTNAQLVTLNYDVEHFIFGIPQMLFLLLAIAVLLLCVIAGYMMMGKYG